MIAQLTKDERQLALIILLVLSVCGFAMAAAGSGDPLGVHGAIVLLAGILPDVRRHFRLLRPRARRRPAGPLFRRSQPDGHYPGDGLGRGGTFCRRLDRVAARLSGPDV